MTRVIIRINRIKLSVVWTIEYSSGRGSDATSESLPVARYSLTIRMYLFLAVAVCITGAMLQQVRLCALNVSALGTSCSKESNRFLAKSLESIDLPPTCTYRLTRVAYVCVLPVHMDIKENFSAAAKSDDDDDERMDRLKPAKFELYLYTRAVGKSLIWKANKSCLRLRIGGAGAKVVT